MDSHIAMGYWYKNDNPNSTDEFMPPKLMADAFYRTLQDFPILAGHIMTDKYSRIYIDVNKDSLNMPVYTDTICDLDYSAMEKIGFNVKKLPIDLYGTYGVPVPSKLSSGKIKLANIRILRVKYSINDILTTYLGIVVAQAKQKAKIDKESKLYAVAFSKLFGRNNAKAPVEFDVLININVRSHVEHTNIKNYMGNMNIAKSAKFPYDLIQNGPTVENIATLAQKLRQIASEPHFELYAQRGFLLDIRPENLAYNTFFSQKGNENLVTSNHSRFSHYEVDFGSGAPALVRHAWLSSNGTTYIMPTNPKTGGYDVELRLAPDEMENVIQNTSWTELVDSYERNS
ncbi:hypothetical protein IWW48_006141 [Coemansia sp. RSA 1200]|nr:hypothetical protein IWW48_006141 [Coemansia sp. RSA 1200]